MAFLAILCGWRGSSLRHLVAGLLATTTTDLPFGVTRIHPKDLACSRTFVDFVGDKQPRKKNEVTVTKIKLAAAFSSLQAKRCAPKQEGEAPQIDPPASWQLYGLTRVVGHV